jgi:hypothetical protein
LLPGKSKAVYEYVFEELKVALLEEFGDCGPAKTILMDQEDGVRDAILSIEEFEYCQFKSCYFHFGQNLIRYINGVGLKTVYETEVNLRNWFDCIMGKSIKSAKNKQFRYRVFASCLSSYFSGSLSVKRAFHVRQFRHRIDCKVCSLHEWLLAP